MSGSQVPPPPPGAVTEGGENAVVIRKQVVREAGKDQARTTESLGTESLEGVQATGTRTTFTIPLRREGWASSLQADEASRQPVTSPLRGSGEHLVESREG